MAGGVPASEDLHRETVILGALDEDVGDGGLLLHDREVHVNGNGNGNGHGSGHGQGNGSSGGFRPDEMVKIQGRDFVVIGGRLRVLHATSPKCSITTTVFDFELGHHALVFARVQTETGEFGASAVATAARDPKLAESLVELAETRAVARALRFAGIGVECCGFEELGAGAVLDGSAPRQEPSGTGADDANCGPADRATIGATPRLVRSRSTPATAAQRRCIEALARRVHQNPVTAAVRLAGVQLDELSMMEASRVIDGLKNGANGNGDRGPNSGGQR